MPTVFEIKIDRVEVNEFFIKPRPMDLAGATSVEFNYDIGIANKVAPEPTLIIQMVTINVSVKSKPSDTLSSINLSVGYVIKNFSEAVQFKEGRYIIDSKLELRLRNISIGTTRGVLLSRLQGTYLQAAVLPIVLDNT